MPHSTSVDVTTSDRLSMRGQRLLKTILHINLKPQRENATPTQIMEHGTSTNKNGDKFELWLFNTAECKIVGTKKEIRQVKKIVEPEKSIFVEEEVDVPIYECPKGVTMK